MIFLDPKSDIAFKKLFGSENHKHIFLSFVNTVLGRKEGERIVDVIFNDPYNPKETPEDKLSIVDVRCTDEMGKRYILEMQQEDARDYGMRAQYYVARALNRQLLNKGHYRNLVPVIFIGVLDFNLFEDHNYISHHCILNTKTHTHELKHMEFHFIELPKFNKNIEEVTTILEKWVYMFKYASELNTIPKNFKEPEIQEAFDILERSTWSMDDIDAYVRYMDILWSHNSQIDTAIEKGIEKGIQKGIEQGIEQGIEKGIEKGQIQAKLAIAQEFLDVVDDQTLAHKTGLTLFQIEELRKSKK